MSSSFSPGKLKRFSNEDCENGNWEDGKRERERVRKRGRGHEERGALGREIKPTGNGNLC